MTRKWRERSTSASVKLLRRFLLNSKYMFCILISEIKMENAKTKQKQQQKRTSTYSNAPLNIEDNIEQHQHI